MPRLSLGISISRMHSQHLSLYEQLDINATRLFSDEDESALNFLELSSRGKGTEPPCTLTV